MLWALAQPAAMAGLVAAFAIGVGLRAAVARIVRFPRDGVSARFDPLGVVAACFCGTGWGRPSAAPRTRREWLAVAAGPGAVLLASQLIIFCTCAREVALLFSSASRPSRHGSRPAL